MQWALGESVSAATALPGGVTQCEFTLPAAWLAELPNVTSGAAACLLTTCVGGTARGTRQIGFTAAVPARYAPEIDSFSVRRYAEATNAQGQTIYADSLTGERVRVSLEAHLDGDGGLNPGTARIRYYPAGREDAEQTVTVPWSGDRLLLAEDRGIIVAEIAASEGWVFELTVSNGHSEAHAAARVEKSWTPLHVAGTGYGVGVGMYSDGTREDPRFQVAWPAQMLGGITGVTDYSEQEAATGGHWIDGRPLYTRTLVMPIQGGRTILGDIGPDVDVILQYSGVLVTDRGSQRPICWPYSSSLYCSVYRYLQNESIAVLAGESGTAYVTILYVKRGS